MEVESPSLFRLQPALDLCALMGAIVVHDEMHLLVGGKLRFQMIQELHKLTAAMALLAGADDLAVENMECGKQSCGAVALVVVCLPFWQAGPQRKNGCGAIQCLNLAFLINTQDQSAVRRIQIQAYDVAHFFLEARILG